jgi:MFS family permease
MKNNSFEALKIPDVRFFLGSVGFFTLASRALVVIIGFQVYQITHSAFALGLLGLIEAVPAMSLVLVGGYVADHFNRRTILLITRAASFFCALALVFLSLGHSSSNLVGLYAVIFLAGIARAFADPANSAFEAQVVPQHLTVSAASWISSTWVSCSIIGPAAIGFIFESYQAAGCYLIVSVCFAISWVCTAAIAPKHQPKPEKESLIKSVGIGWKFVFNNQALSGAMALDLFAVLFGGVVALLPIYANDILHVGAKGLGLLNAATSVGALSMMLLSTKFAPQIIAMAGRNLMLAVAGFGLAVICFAFSKHFWLSMFLLMLSGICDGVSMVIRRSMVRLLTPNDMRGRVSAVNWIFICASNELGAFQSGMLAALIGTIPCVAVGGLATLGVVAITARFAPQLRHLRFDPKTLERK